ncbi:hypothetical protein [Hyphomicrobium sp.]|uniref:hypothetical protein n=1 Tax=Hyphomicrobium sp. TaxID=82 RepID=UPI0025B7A914|nr:hypothetical protein [Hyphomicrobium sp.]MCC7251446.1 hypothetical protein [Hyphomicrobium sp.]
MFQGLFKRAERSFDQAVTRVMGRALVAVPLLVAGGFATAALAVKLVELYGAVTAYALMAALFCVIGLVTMAIVGIEQRPAAETAEEPSASTAEGSSDDAADTADLFSPEVRAIFASAAPVALPGLIRGVGRNLPLVFILALVAFVISRFAETSDEHEAATTDAAAAPVPPAAAA